MGDHRGRPMAQEPAIEHLVGPVGRVPVPVAGDDEPRACHVHG
jgi:hypothetical protein